MGVTQLRRALASDATTIARLQIGLFDSPWSEELLCSVLQSSVSLSLMALVDEVPVGFLVGRMVVDEGEILVIGVGQRVQRRGIGRLLLTAWLESLTTLGARLAFLEVAADNEPAVALYGRCGFASVGRRPGYYHRADGSVADGVSMMLELQGSPAA